MIINDLIKDNIYYIRDGNDWSIFKFYKINDSDRINSSFSIFSNWNDNDREDVNFKKNMDWWITGRNLRKATSFEIKWLENCIKSNKVISFDKIKNIINYEIY